MEAMREAVVNGRRYKVTMFDPMTAFDFFLELEHCKSSGKPYSHLAKRAIGQCRTPETGKPLSEPAVFQEHFSRHPEDMLPLMSGAMEEICRPFVKASPDTSKAEIV